MRIGLMASLRLRVVAQVASIERSSRWASLWSVNMVKLSRCCGGELLTAVEEGLEVRFGLYTVRTTVQFVAIARFDLAM
jgi:hypothetical protein